MPLPCTTADSRGAAAINAGTRRDSFVRHNRKPYEIASRAEQTDPGHEVVDT